MRVAKKEEAEKENEKMKVDKKGTSSTNVPQFSRNGPNMHFQSLLNTTSIFYLEKPNLQERPIRDIRMKECSLLFFLNLICAPSQTPRFHLEKKDTLSSAWSASKMF